jgi:hypothetical protein
VRVNRHHADLLTAASALQTAIAKVASVKSSILEALKGSSSMGKTDHPLATARR